MVLTAGSLRRDETTAATMTGHLAQRRSARSFSTGSSTPQSHVGFRLAECALLQALEG